METNSSFHHINSTVKPVSSSNYYANLRYSLHIMSLCVYGVACVLGVLGNGMVIWVTGFGMKRTVNTVWFLNLAVADFLFTAFLPLGITYQALHFNWIFGRFMCKLNSTVNFLNLYASVYTLVVISVDRFVSVVWPIWAQVHRTVRKASYVSLCVWALALCLSLPAFVFRDTEVFNNNSVCYNNYALSKNYTIPSVVQLALFRHRNMTITRFLMGFPVPFGVIVSCYSIIIHRLRRNPVLAKRSSRPFKLIATIIITFFLCWAPFHIMSIIELKKFDPSYKSETLKHVIAIGIPITTSLAFLNSCLNPFLYVFIGHDFRDKVCTSILKVFETVFQEDETNTYTKSVTSSESKRSNHSSAV
ncbi:chemokine-like receptor 1 [Cyprinodon tularosa]|uniref:chemokine-like receptor 1 n=1 Tax=Cyprinodon tularosa TaxID=77115 RepID=UPI0018E21E8B|nr:chemokine-like receptor 1 [Cyprinodon tularosa]XP_038141432.1 chemokine-like receptor 1 [Cyprinodon tularosa]